MMSHVDTIAEYLRLIGLSKAYSLKDNDKLYDKVFDIASKLYTHPTITLSTYIGLAHANDDIANNAHKLATKFIEEGDILHGIT